MAALVELSIQTLESAPRAAGSREVMFLLDQNFQLIPDKLISHARSNGPDSVRRNEQTVQTIHHRDVVVYEEQRVENKDMGAVLQFMTARTRTDRCVEHVQVQSLYSFLLRGCTPEISLEISENIIDILNILRYLNSPISQEIFDMVRYHLGYLKISQIERDIF